MRRFEDLDDPEVLEAVEIRKINSVLSEITSFLTNPINF